MTSTSNTKKTVFDTSPLAEVVVEDPYAPEGILSDSKALPSIDNVTVDGEDFESEWVQGLIDGMPDTQVEALRNDYDVSPTEAFETLSKKLPTDIKVEEVLANTTVYDGFVNIDAVLDYTADLPEALSGTAIGNMLDFISNVHCPLVPSLLSLLGKLAAMFALSMDLLGIDIPKCLTTSPIDDLMRSMGPTQLKNLKNSMLVANVDDVLSMTGRTKLGDVKLLAGSDSPKERRYIAARSKVSPNSNAAAKLLTAKQGEDLVKPVLSAIDKYGKSTVADVTKVVKTSDPDTVMGVMNKLLALPPNELHSDINGIATSDGISELNDSYGTDLVKPVTLMVYADPTVVEAVPAIGELDDISLSSTMGVIATSGTTVDDSIELIDSMLDIGSNDIEQVSETLDVFTPKELGLVSEPAVVGLLNNIVDQVENHDSTTGEALVAAKTQIIRNTERVNDLIDLQQDTYYNSSKTVMAAGTLQRELVGTIVALDTSHKTMESISNDTGTILAAMTVDSIVPTALLDSVMVDLRKLVSDDSIVQLNVGDRAIVNGMVLTLVSVRDNEHSADIVSELESMQTQIGNISNGTENLLTELELLNTGLNDNLIKVAAAQTSYLMGTGGSTDIVNELRGVSGTYLSLSKVAHPFITANLDMGIESAATTAVQFEELVASNRLTDYSQTAFISGSVITKVIKDLTEYSNSETDVVVADIINSIGELPDNENLLTSVIAVQLALSKDESLRGELVYRAVESALTYRAKLLHDNAILSAYGSTPESDLLDDFVELMTGYIDLYNSGVDYGSFKAGVIGSINGIRFIPTVDLYVRGLHDDYTVDNITAIINLVSIYNSTVLLVNNSIQTISKATIEALSTDSLSLVKLNSVSNQLDLTYIPLVALRNDNMVVWRKVLDTISGLQSAQRILEGYINESTAYGIKYELEEVDVLNVENYLVRLHELIKSIVPVNGEEELFTQLAIDIDKVISSKYPVDTRLDRIVALLDETVISITNLLSYNDSIHQVLRDIAGTCSFKMEDTVNIYSLSTAIDSMITSFNTLHVEVQSRSEFVTLQRHLDDAKYQVGGGISHIGVLRNKLVAAITSTTIPTPTAMDAINTTMVNMNNSVSGLLEASNLNIEAIRTGLVLGELRKATDVLEGNETTPVETITTAIVANVNSISDDVDTTTLIINILNRSARGGLVGVVAGLLNEYPKLRPMVDRYQLLLTAMSSFTATIPDAIDMSKAAETTLEDLESIYHNWLFTTRDSQVVHNHLPWVKASKSLLDVLSYSATVGGLARIELDVQK